VPVGDAVAGEDVSVVLQECRHLVVGLETGLVRLLVHDLHGGEGRAAATVVVARPVGFLLFSLRWR